MDEKTPQPRLCGEHGTRGERAIYLCNEVDDAQRGAQAGDSDIYSRKEIPPIGTPCGWLLCGLKNQKDFD